MTLSTGSKILSALGERVVYGSGVIINGSPVIRVVFPKHNLVVKMFDPDQGEFYSVKLWKGDMDRVIAHWRMKPLKRDILPHEERVLLKALEGWVQSTKDFNV